MYAFKLNLQEVGYDSALSLIIDIRTVIPGSGTTAPVGWAALPLFQSGPGRYMASGYYHLPIFKVHSSSAVLQSALVLHCHTMLGYVMQCQAVSIYIMDRMCL